MAATDAFIDSVAVALTVAEEAEVRKMSPDLQFILGECEVPIRVQFRLGQLGFSTLQLFSVVADDRASFRTFVATSFPMDPAEVNLAAPKKAACQLYTAQLLAAWNTASQRVTESERISAESKSSRLPVLVPKVTLINLRRRYEADHGRVTDSLWPCANMIEKMFEELEDGGLTTLPLTEVINAEKGVDDVQSLVEVIAGSGTVKMRKAPKALPPPKNTEEFRNRMVTLSICFSVAAYKHSTRLWLKTTSPELWRKYTEHILGEEVAAYKTVVNGQEFSASWETVLNYEYQIRKAATKKILYEDMDLRAALAAAQADLQVKERFFITPTAIAAGANSRSSSTGYIRGEDRARPYAQKGDKGGKGSKPAGKSGKNDKGGKGSEKGGKSGSNARRKQFQALKTPDGRLICNSFQTGTCNYSDKCRYVHVCGKCFGDHPSSGCNKN